MVVSLGMNISALRAQRRVGDSQTELGRIFERISSGLRINRASDDAAGLAISSELQADARVYSQGVRNINDGISLLNIADSSLEELSSVVVRLSELATQSANGTLSTEQRRSLDAEADALVEEYNRIIESTEFNEQSVLQAEFSGVRVQAGYGVDGSIRANVSEGLIRHTGDGSYSETFNTTYAGEHPQGTSLGDVNNDGNLDLVIGAKYVRLGNGDGTFQSESTVGGGTNLTAELGDMNNDGNLDLVFGNSTDLITRFGNGDGTFQAAQTVSGTTGAADLKLGDFNGDGILDSVVLGQTTGYTVVLGDGAGGTIGMNTFTNGSSDTREFEVADLDEDGDLDVVGGAIDQDAVEIYLNDGSGNFALSESIALSEAYAIALGDFNGDGRNDIAATTVGNLQILIAKDDGSYETGQFINTNISRSLTSGDLNGDGIVDLIGGNVATGNSLQIVHGDGEGHFSLQSPISFTGRKEVISLGDLNGDSTLDVVSSDFVSGGAIAAFVQGTNETTRIETFNLANRATSLAALERFDELREQISSARGDIGASMKRLEVARNNLHESRHGALQASERIQSADMAQESSALVRKQIHQQAAAAVLSQANVQPQIALQLL
jgi:flagellin